MRRRRDVRGDGRASSWRREAGGEQDHGKKIKKRNQRKRAHARTHTRNATRILAKETSCGTCTGSVLGWDVLHQRTSFGWPEYTQHVMVVVPVRRRVRPPGTRRPGDAPGPTRPSLNHSHQRVVSGNLTMNGFACNTAVEPLYAFFFPFGWHTFGRRRLRGAVRSGQLVKTAHVLLCPDGFYSLFCRSIFIR